jgi:stage II sporulation protein AA (anti-sigma F factor antagonist)
MNLTISTIGTFTVVTIEGRIDTTNAMEFESRMVEQINLGSSKIILDCSGLNYISSSGLRAFLVLNKKMAAGDGLFRICSLQPGIREIFDISGFTSIFAVFPDLESAAKN